MKKLYIFSSFHYDVAYRKTYREYLPECFHIINSALDLLDKHGDFIFNIEQIILLDAYWKKFPGKRKKLKKFAQQKRLIFCPGMWTMPDNNLPGVESYYQNYLLGHEWLKKHLNVVPGPICWMADLFGHNAQSPQIYSQLGYQLYMFERGQLADCSEVDFIWQGIDGSKINAHWEADTYFGLQLCVTWFERDNSFELVKSKTEKLVINPLKNKTGIAFSKIGGDFLVPGKDHFDFIKTWNTKVKKPCINFAHPQVYIDHLEKRQESLPVIDKELNPLLQGTYSSRIIFKQLNRKFESFLYALQTLSVMEQRSPNFNRLWRDLTTTQFHDIICGSLGNKPFKDVYKFYQRLEKTLEEKLGLEKSKPGRHKNFSLYNPLPYPRNEVIELPTGPEFISISSMTAIPAGKIATLKKYPPVISKKPLTLANSLIQIQVDEYGRLTGLNDLISGLSYKDKRYDFIHNIMVEPDTGDPWVPRQGTVNPSQLHCSSFHDPIVPEGIDYDFKSSTKKVASSLFARKKPAISIKISKNKCQGTITVMFSEDFILEYKITSNSKLIRIAVTRRLSFIQSRIRAVFPTGIKNGRIRREIPGGSIQTPEGEYPAQNWVEYSNSEKGICILNKGLPGNNVTDGVIMLTLFRSAAILETGIVPEFQYGETFNAEYAIYPFHKKDKNYLPTRLGQLYNHPILPVPYPDLPPSPINIHLDNLNAEITWMKFNRRSNSIMLRLFNSIHKPNKIKILLNKQIKAAEKITPTEETISALNYSPKHLVLKTRPFEIVTLRIHLKV